MDFQHFLTAIHSNKYIFTQINTYIHFILKVPQLFITICCKLQYFLVHSNPLKRKKCCL